MLDILLLFPVSWRFFQSSYDKGGCGGNNGDGSLSILDCELDCDSQTFLNGR